MDTNLVIAVIFIIFALIVVSAFLVFRQRGKVKIKGPLSTGLELDASNESPLTPGVRIEDAKAKKGGLLAEDRTGRGADVRGIETQDDIIVSSSSPDPYENPKVGPPK
ncbi:MAG: hypothetical protein KDJ65_11280 [Anaerolineae bacterium]|nr:hypothetical protein [Anaerolineae bacterium]